jgi:hypothetical protein
MMTANPHLIWISPILWMVVGYGIYAVYRSGYQGVALSTRSGRLKTLGRIYNAQNKPVAFWLAVVWNASVSLSGGLIAGMMLWGAWSADLNLAVYSFLLFGCLLSLSEIVYRFTLRAC